MSHTYHVYLGPYIEATPNTVDEWGVTEAIREALSVVRSEGGGFRDAHIYIPNVDRPGVDREMGFIPREDGDRMLPLEHGIVIEEMIWLRKAFVDEIAILRTRYTRIEIKWGLLMWVY